MRYNQINYCSITDGVGVRISLYLQGCSIRCKGCHNPESWDFCGGKEFTEQEEQDIIKALKQPYIQGLTLCGGEPWDQQEGLLKFVRKVKKECPDKDIWCYTGYEFEDLVLGGKMYTSFSSELMSYIDVLVTGPFILEKRDISDNNRWRGSTNQRVVDVQATLDTGIKTYVKGIPNNE